MLIEAEIHLRECRHAYDTNEIRRRGLHLELNILCFVEKCRVRNWLATIWILRRGKVVRYEVWHLILDVVSFEDVSYSIEATYMVPVTHGQHDFSGIGLCIWRIGVVHYDWTSKSIGHLSHDMGVIPISARNLQLRLMSVYKYY